VGPAPPRLPLRLFKAISVALREKEREPAREGAKGKAANNLRGTHTHTARERVRLRLRIERERGGRRRWSRRRRRARLTAPLRCGSAGFAMTRRTSGAPPWSRPAPAPAPSRYVCAFCYAHPPIDGLSYALLHTFSALLCSVL